jgi:hypothetical protein
MKITNNESNKLKKEGRKKLLMVIAFFIVLVSADTFCFGVLLETAGEALWIVVVFGIVLGCITNIASYLCAERGIGHVGEITHERDTANAKKDRIIAKINASTEITETEKNKIIVEAEAVKNRVIAETIKDIKFAWGIFFLTLTIVLVVQSILAYSRLSQIDENISAHKVALENWKEIEIKDQRHLRNMPIYANGESSITKDRATVIIPILTSILSFVIGLWDKKKYDKFDKEFEKKCAIVSDIYNQFQDEIQSHRDSHSDARRKLEEDKEKELSDLKTRTRTLTTEAYKIISEIEATGELSGLEDALMKLIRDNQTKPESDCRKKLGEKLKQTLPEYYELHIDRLGASLNKIASDIKAELSGMAQNPKDFDSHTLKQNYQERLKEITDPSTDIFNEKRRSIDET